jgi:hypothetical protein
MNIIKCFAEILFLSILKKIICINAGDLSAKKSVVSFIEIFIQNLFLNCGLESYEDGRVKWGIRWGDNFTV